jgi:hypothetical protein
MGGANQAGYDTQQGAMQGMLGQVAGQGPLNTDNLQSVNPGALQPGVGMGSFNMDPIGNSKAIQDATYGLLSPQRDLARNSMIQRLKSQGLSEDSPAFQRAMLTQGQADTDAQLKSLLAGTTEYGNQFNRGLDSAKFGSANQAQGFSQGLDTQKLALALRGQQFGEKQAVHDQPLKDLTTLSGVKGYQSPEFGKFVTATDPGGVDYAGAGRDQATADIAKWNAAQKVEADKTNGMLGLAGSVLGSQPGTVGGKMVDAAGNFIGDAAGDIWGSIKNSDWFKSIWS